MYAISALIKQAFYQDKSARKRYLQITGYTRTTSALNRLARIIDSGEIDQTMVQALLESGISAEQISNTISATAIEKHQQREARFKPWLKASFNLVPAAQREVNVPAMFIGHMSCIELPAGLTAHPWSEQLLEIKALITHHRRCFYSDTLGSARNNYFGDISGYQYSPAPQLIVNLLPTGELPQSGKS